MFYDGRRGRVLGRRNVARRNQRTVGAKPRHRPRVTTLITKKRRSAAMNTDERQRDPPPSMQTGSAESGSLDALDDKLSGQVDLFNVHVWSGRDVNGSFESVGSVYNNPKLGGLRAVIVMLSNISPLGEHVSIQLRQKLLMASLGTWRPCCLTTGWTETLRHLGLR